MSEYKVFGIGDIICLHGKDIVECQILDCGIYMTDSGTYEWGFYLKSEHCKDHWCPSFIVDGLLKKGFFYKKGKEKIANKIREIRTFR